ncbi:hypothetical protein GOP47_0023988 [Adiantum capillus-veneris]|uniref:Uncharacterized protein n=1 Tax=Adiantum capillus-veneris TaxID=13818 RepID=A0A9D4U4T2_ADICA|nr:hypothetical protein GOP47_0023988 [Adiantum capillus-veneris]
MEGFIIHEVDSSLVISYVNILRGILNFSQQHHEGYNSISRCVKGAPSIGVQENNVFTGILMQMTEQLHNAEPEGDCEA